MIPVQEHFECSLELESLISSRQRISNGLFAVYNSMMPRHAQHKVLSKSNFDRKRKRISKLEDAIHGRVVQRNVSTLEENIASHGKNNELVTTSTLFAEFDVNDFMADSSLFFYGDVDCSKKDETLIEQKEHAKINSPGDQDQDSTIQEEEKKEHTLPKPTWYWVL